MDPDLKLTCFFREKIINLISFPLSFFVFFGFVYKKFEFISWLYDDRLLLSVFYNIGLVAGYRLNVFQV